MNASTKIYTDRKIGLGWTADGARVVAEITLTPGTPDHMRTSTHHEQIPDPDRLSITFVLGRSRHEPEMWGQVPAADRVIARRVVKGENGSNYTDASPELEAWINEAWERWHLNDVRGACAHMTPEMLAHHDGESTTDWQGRMLADTVCPETGYRWGHAWLAEALPDHIIQTARNIIDHGTAAEIVTETEAVTA